MSITTLVWVALYCSSAVLSLLNPLFGALGYLLEYYMRPELKWWGHELPSLRYNLIISVVLGVTFLMRRSALRELVPVRNPSLKWQLGLATIMLLVTATVAVNREISQDWMGQWIKMAIIFPALLAGVIRTETGFDAIIAAHMLGASWWGWNAWTDPKRAQGRLLNIGSGDTLNDNAAASHLLTVLPFIIVFLLTEKDKRLRTLALVAAPLVINTLVLCNSRGSMVGLGAATMAGFLLVRRGYRARLVGCAVAAVALLFTLADPQFIARQQTTTKYEDDGSAQQRLVTWRAGLRLIEDRPFGAGGRGFHLLSPLYIPEVVEAHNGDFRAPHNTWVMVPSEWGIPGLVCFIGLYASALLALERVKRRARDAEQPYYYWRAFALQLAIIGPLVAGTFTDRLYGEAGYWMVGLSYALTRLQLTAQAKDTSAVAAPAAPVVSTVTVPWRLAGARS